MVWTIGSCTGFRQKEDESEVGGHYAEILRRRKLFIETAPGKMRRSCFGSMKNQDNPRSSLNVLSCKSVLGRAGLLQP